MVEDGRAVTDGGWPSVSPDRTKLAVERSGRVWFTNLDGSNPTEGPAGTTPVWMANGSHLAVGGGSVQRVRADGSDRSTLAGGAASLPALGPGGRIAVVSGDALEVDGQGRLLGGVSGRPAWSPSGAWLVVPAGGELVLVDASGAAPPASLGLAGATDPAWRGSAPSASPASPAIRALEPEPAIPGGEVRLVGSGFDWIIPTNNRVFFPGADGPVEGDVLAATPGTLTALMPATTVAGTIRVRTPQGEATVGFQPLAGSIRVRVQSGEEPVAGVPVVVRQDASEVAKIATDARGEASFALPPGDYGVGIGATPGYRIDSPNPVAVRLSFAVSEVAFRLVPVPARVTIEPEAPVHVPIGTTVNVRARAFDAAGNELTDFTSVSWGGSSRLEVSGKGLSGQLTGVELSRRPGDAGFAVALNGERFRFGATVTAFIEGTVIIDESGESRPARGRTVFLTDDDVRALAETETDRNGRYRFARLLARTLPRPRRPAQQLRRRPRRAPHGRQPQPQEPGLRALAHRRWWRPAAADRDALRLLEPRRDHVLPARHDLRSRRRLRPRRQRPGTPGLRTYLSAGGINAVTIQAYLDGGGIVITEYNISDDVWNAAFATNISLGRRESGGCTDVIPSVVQFTPGDPFWQDNVFQALPYSSVGCGYAVGNYPGITPILGWTSTAVALGYRDSGAGRVWAADFDWQDTNTTGPAYAYTEQLMGYMITHRADP